MAGTVIVRAWLTFGLLLSRQTSRRGVPEAFRDRFDDLSLRLPQRREQLLQCQRSHLQSALWSRRGNVRRHRERRQRWPVPRATRGRWVLTAAPNRADANGPTNSFHAVATSRSLGDQVLTRPRFQALALVVAATARCRENLAPIS